MSSIKKCQFLRSRMELQCWKSTPRSLNGWHQDVSRRHVPFVDLHPCHKLINSSEATWLLYGSLVPGLLQPYSALWMTPRLSVTLHSSFGHHNGLLSGISIFHQPYLLFPDLDVFAILYLAPCSEPVCSGIDCWMTCYSPVVAFWASLPLTLPATDKFSSHLDVIIVTINNNNGHIHCFSFFKPFQINFL